MWASTMLSPLTRREKTSPSPSREGSRKSSSSMPSIASEGLPAGVPLAFQDIQVIEAVFLGDPEAVGDLFRRGRETVVRHELPDERQGLPLRRGERVAHAGRLTYL